MARSKHRRIVVLCAASLAFGYGAVACTYDFHLFDSMVDGSAADGSVSDETSTGSEGGGGGEGGAGDDAGLDAHLRDADAADVFNACAVPPPASCLDAGGACSKQCSADETTCKGNCGILDPNCPKNCEKTATTCKDGCYSACLKCTGDAGCEDPPRCNFVVNPP